MKIEEAKDYVEENACEGYFENQVVMPKEEILALLDQIELDQPKLEVPQFVADWYEEHKDNFYLNLHRLAWELIENLDEDDFVPKNALDSDFKRWYHKTETAAQTLNNMHQFGYTVQKLYTVEIPNPHEKQLSYVLMRQPNGNVIINVVHSSNLDLLKTDNDLQLTEKEIKKDFDWAWQWKKEVTE